MLRLLLCFLIYSLSISVHAEGEVSLKNTAFMPLPEPDPGHVYKGGDVKQFIIHYPLHRKKDEQTALPNSQKSTGNTGRPPKNEDNRQGYKNNKSHEGHQQQPGAATQSDSGGEEVATTVTITFIGQFDAGKSSLANCMLNYNHFPVQCTQTQYRERDALLIPAGAAREPQIRVRSMPGYGGAGKRTWQWLRDYPVAPSEIVVFVLRNSINELDIRLIQGLIEGGLSPERILFVRNKFDVVLEQKLRELNLQPDSEVDAEKVNHVKIDFQNQLSDELNASLRSQLINPDGTPYRERPMLFTSSKDICSGKGIPELLAAIKQSMRQTRQTAVYERWDEFCWRRLMNTSHLLNQWIESFIDVVRSNSDAVFYDLLTTLNKEYQFPSPDVERTLRQFNGIFKTDLERQTVNLQERLAQTSIDTGRAAQQASNQYQLNNLDGTVSRIAEELSRRGYFTRRSYVREKIKIAKKITNESAKSAKTYRRQAKEQSRQYLEEHRGETLKTTRKHNWLDWFTLSDSHVITRFAAQMEEILLAESVSCENESASGEADAQSQYSSYSDSQSSISSVQQVLEEELATLARQFAVFYLSYIYGPAIYQKPLSEEPEPEVFPGPYPAEYLERLSSTHAESQPDRSASPEYMYIDQSGMSPSSDYMNVNVNQPGRVASSESTYINWPNQPAPAGRIYQNQPDKPALPDHEHDEPATVTLSRRLQYPTEQASDDESEPVKSKTPLTPYNSILKQGQLSHPAASLLPPELTELVNQNIGATVEASKQLLDKLSAHTGVMLRPQLKALVKEQLGLQRLPASKALFREGFYRKGIIITGLYAYGLTPKDMADIDGSARIIELLKSSSYYSGITLALKNALDYADWETRDKRNYDGFLKILEFSAKKKKYLGLPANPMTILIQLNNPKQRIALFRTLQQARRENSSLK